MAFFEERGGVRHYFQSRREGTKVVKYSLGLGVVGEAAAGLVLEARRRRADRAGVLAAERARLATPDAALAALEAACDLMVEAELTAEGYHRHDYHRWRKRRVRQLDKGSREAGE
jgi:hypothetical protein